MRNIILSKTSVILATAGLLVGSVSLAVPTLASNEGHFGLGLGVDIGAFFKTGNLSHPALFGTVTAVSGNTVTVISKNTNDNASIVYTVDATSAAVTKGVGKNAQTIAVSGLTVNDKVIVFGTFNGTSVTATSITDFGTPPAKNDKRKRAVAGTVVSVNGNTIIVTGRDNVTYTVDATNAVIYKGSKTPVNISSVVSGDKVVVFGTMTNTSIAATKIFDGNLKKGHKGFGIRFSFGKDR